MKLAFTTSRGTVIPPRTLSTASRELEEGTDTLDVINYTLRDCIPVHDDDFDEVNEVISYLEDAAMDAWVERECSSSAPLKF